MELSKLEKMIGEKKNVYFQTKGKRVYTIDLSKNNCWLNDDVLFMMSNTKLYCFNVCDIYENNPKEKEN